MSYKIIDSHFHAFGGNDCGRFLKELLEKGGIDGICIASVPKGLAHGELFCNAEALKLKKANQGKVYFFGGLDYSDKSYLKGKVDFAEQAKKLFESGADGMKMLEGKPNARKELGLPIDSPIFDSYYSYLEDNSFPILMHVADPEEFWDPGKAPEFAKEHGWFWGDGSFPSKEQLYAETEGVLKKFPNLKLILAHFYFMSADVGKASEFMDKWKNVSFDITPGCEMYHNFSKRRSEWRVFFRKYNDRIIFGTDNVPPSKGKSLNHFDYNVGIISEIRKFLETDSEVFSGRGLKLDRISLKNIYCDNFLNAIKKK